MGPVKFIEALSEMKFDNTFNPYDAKFTTLMMHRADAQDCCAQF
jgi:hypothetical protein